MSFDRWIGSRVADGKGTVLGDGVAAERLGTGCRITRQTALRPEPLRVGIDQRHRRHRHAHDLLDQIDDALKRLRFSGIANFIAPEGREAGLFVDQLVVLHETPAAIVPALCPGFLRACRVFT